MLSTSRGFLLPVLLVVAQVLSGCGSGVEFLNKRQQKKADQLSLTGPNGYPYCTNGSDTGGGYGWDTKVTDPKGSHSCLVPPKAPNGYPYCTNGSNNGDGWGWDPGITDPRGSHSCVVPPPSGGSDTGTDSAGGGTLPTLDVAASGNSTYNIHDYGATLGTNKQALVKAINSAGATAQEKAVLIAIAMQETTYMSPSERDPSKDRTPSANVSILNINYDMLTKLGYTGQDYGSSLNDPAKLTEVVKYVIKGMRTWGMRKTLDYIRGGWTAFQDGVSYGAYDYRNAILTIYKRIAADLNLETDGRRVQISVQHV